MDSTMEKHASIYSILITCQYMIRNDAKFMTVVEFLKIAREFYGKEALIKAMKEFGFKELISLLDFK